MSSYLETAMGEIEHDWRAEISFQRCEAARCALYSIEWMVGHLEHVPDVYMALGRELSRWKNGSGFDEKNFKKIAEKACVT